MLQIKNFCDADEARLDRQEAAVLRPDVTQTKLRDKLETLRFERAETLKAADLVPLPGNIVLPDWWTAQHCADRIVFIAKKVRRWDDIVVTQCRSDATVYVQASWID
ncbi:hypothetical protein [Bradyrhizobium sp. HKCCYLS20291]|uniref:hypothetical protein n=1 Tax=Bradyrhizobium sp. HKCCYLS20291 TaxID=3420766 RepID=UPI003EC10DFC